MSQHELDLEDNESQITLDKVRIPPNGMLKRAYNGPNRGRYYYTMPNKEGQQKFFKWADGMPNRTTEDALNETKEQIIQHIDRKIEELINALNKSQSKIK